MDGKPKSLTYPFEKCDCDIHIFIADHADENNMVPSMCLQSSLIQFIHANKMHTSFIYNTELGFYVD